MTRAFAQGDLAPPAHRRSWHRRVPRPRSASPYRRGSQSLQRVRSSKRRLHRRECARSSRPPAHCGAHRPRALRSRPRLPWLRDGSAPRRSSRDLIKFAFCSTRSVDDRCVPGSCLLARSGKSMNQSFLRESLIRSAATASVASLTGVPRDFLRSHFGQGRSCKVREVERSELRWLIRDRLPGAACAIGRIRHEHSHRAGRTGARRPS
jgi:hypothetical protein